LLFDMPLDQLAAYRPDRAEPADFDAFWAATLDEAASHDLEARFEPVETGLLAIRTLDVTFRGYGGQPVKGWLQLPVAGGPLPCVVEYLGYGGGRGLPHEWLVWASAGYAHLVVDVRGQGSGWRVGATADVADGPVGPHAPGFVTQGIEDPHRYYYRRVFTDAVRAVDAARVHPDVDASRIAVTGGSQGGGITLAVAGLVPGLSAVAPDVPFLCAFRRAAEITDRPPYSEIVRYCKVNRHRAESAFATLSYFDGVNMAARATAPALFSVALMDQTCPPSTVYAAFNHYGGPAEIRVWPWNEHEGGEGFQVSEKLTFFRQRLNSRP
jgi:cephalosporin-C deacetylase